MISIKQHNIRNFTLLPRHELKVKAFPISLYMLTLKQSMFHCELHVYAFVLLISSVKQIINITTNIMQRAYKQILGCSKNKGEKKNKDKLKQVKSFVNGIILYINYAVHYHSTALE